MNSYKQIFQNELNNIEKNGLLKRERALKTPQGTEIITDDHINSVEDKVSIKEKEIMTI